MLRRVILVGIFALTVVISTAPATAGERQQIDATPFAHTPCNVLRHRPCTPYYCSVFNHGPCIPEINYPYGENLQLTIESKPSDKDATKYVKPDHDLDTISDLFAALRSCWTPPPEDEARADMQMSVKLSFRRDGRMIAPPRVTYATGGAPQQAREIYQQAISNALDRCAPLALTKGLGGAIAGRPIMIRYVDNRALKSASPAP